MRMKRIELSDPESNAVIVTGGRTYGDCNKVFSVLDKLQPTMVIQGGATGADAIARRWASERGVRCLTLPADWKTHGKAAGPIRNKEMINLGYARTVVAFPGDAGTKNCVEQARRAGLKIFEVRHDEVHD